MKTARGVEGEGFANFVHVSSIFQFSEIRPIMENTNYNKKEILYIGNFTSNQKLATYTS